MYEGVIKIAYTVEYVLYAHGRCILETRRRRGWAYNTYFTYLKVLCDGHVFLDAYDAL